MTRICQFCQFPRKGISSFWWLNPPEEASNRDGVTGKAPPGSDRSPRSRSAAGGKIALLSLAG